MPGAAWCDISKSTKTYSCISLTKTEHAICNCVAGSDDYAKKKK
jgi:hypothetical protein